MYAIKNKITKQWLYGTDYREWPPRQRISNRQVLTFETLEDAIYEFKNRKCDKYEYEIVEVELKIVNDLVKLPWEGRGR